MSPLRAKQLPGFTLVELLVVVLVIGILAAIALPRFLGQRTRAKNAAAQAAVRHALLAARSYYTQQGESYAGLGPSELRGYESSLSGTEAGNGQTPGPSANPQDIWIGDGNDGTNPGGNTVVLCSASRGDKVYCVKDVGGITTYLQATSSSIISAAGGSFTASGWNSTTSPPVTINLLVSSATDDVYRRINTSAWTTNGGSPYNIWNSAGRYDATYYKYGAGLRFTNVTLPAGATITAATLTLTAYQNTGISSGAAKTRIRAQQADNPATFSTQADFDARIGSANDLANGVDPAKIGSSVAWDTIGTSPANNITFTSPDISTVIQEIVNRSGWASGNALVLFWDDFDGRSTDIYGIRFAYDYDTSPLKAPALSITYTTIS